MTFQPPPGQGPIDPRGAFTPPPAPGNLPPPPRTPGMPPGMMPPPPGMPPGMMPPPMPYPPMFMMPPQKQRGGFVRGIFLTLATTIFGLSLTLNIYLLIVSGILSGGATGAHQTNLIDGDPKQKIAVIPISGIIMEEMSAKLERWLRSVEKDENVKAVIIEIDSPGGSVTASDEIWHRIKKLKADNPSRPVIVAMNGLAASGGYYVACAGDYVFAQPSTLTGNIGVLLPQYNFSKLMEKWGIDEKTIVSQGADFKNAGSWFKPESPQERAYLQEIADKAFAQFKDVVAKGRQGKLKKPLSEIANGKIYLADDAAALGLIDQIGYAEDVYAYAASKAGLSRMTVVKYRDPPTFLDALAGNSRVGAPQSNAVAINGVNVSGNDLRELLTPRLMYLWRGQ